MNITKAYTFEQDIDTIFSCYTSEEFVRKKAEALGGRNVEVKIKTEAGTTIVEIVREMPVKVPGPLKKFAKPWNKMRQKEVWKGSPGGPYHANMELEIEEVPVKVRGSMELVANDKGTIATNNTEINSSIPFFGKMVVKFAVEASESAIEEDIDYVRRNA